MASKDLTFFKENVNIEGIKEKILIIDCYSCLEKEKNIYTSKICKFCFLKSLFENKDRKFDYISLLQDSIIIKPKKYNMFLSYFKHLKKIKSVNQKIEDIRRQKCKYKEFSCKILPNFPSLKKINDSEYYDPIIIYNFIIKRYEMFKHKKIHDSICQGCFDYYDNLERSLIRLFSRLEIIGKLKNWQNNDIKIQKSEFIYDLLFSGSLFLTKNNRNNKNNTLKEDWELLHSYRTGEYNIFHVHIYMLSYENEKRYTVKSFFNGKENEDYFENVIQDTLQNLEIDEFDKLIPLESLLEIYKIASTKYLNSKFKFSKVIRNKIGIIAALKKLNFNKLFPLLVDDFIEEIFLDSPDDAIYINHQIYGRCRTEIRFNLREIERIKTFFRLYSGKRLDFINPTIKFVLKNKYFYCRFSIDVNPIQINNFALDIRKLNKNILTIQDLLKNGTLDPLIAAFLYFNVLRRKNITATGETDTGKTTLINAFDLLTPKEFRKIYIENITESLNQVVFKKHQLKYKVDSLESTIDNKYSKSNLIKTLLHRTPDIIYLGEILTKEEAKAMFHCLAAGLRGFQTIHSKNIDSLINRFLYNFNINQSCLNDLDLIILMKKDLSKRRIIGIFEIYKNPTESNNMYSPLIKYNPQFQKWELCRPLYTANVIKELLNYEDLPKTKFNLYMKIFIEIFKYLLRTEMLTNKELVNFFHKISYYSLRSIETLTSFWNKWKKNRGLNL